MTGRPVIVEEQIPGPRPERGLRRKLFVVSLVSLVTVAGLVAMTRDDSESTVQVSADQPIRPSVGNLDGSLLTDPPPPSTTAPVRPESTATTAPPTTATRPTTTTTPLDETTDTPVMTASDGRWRLSRVAAPGRRCLQLTVGSTTSDKLLCDAPPPAGLWGDYATVSTPIGTVVVAMVDPVLTDMKTLFAEGVFPQFGADPHEGGRHYAVGVIHNLGGASASSPLDLFLMQGENTLGRAPVSLAAGPHPAPKVVTTGVYGTWPGYRKAGYTGLFWGGNEDVGFYDNPSGDGTRCVLWRRFGGPREGTILDVCPPPADAVFPFAEVRTEAGTNGGGVRAAIVVDTPTMTRWTCTWDTGNSCFGSAGMTIVDPAGSGRSFLAYFPGAFTRQGDRVTITAYDGSRTLSQITLDVQPA